MVVFSLTLNRYATYALSLAALIATGLATQWGYMNWATKWHLWSGVRWSELDRLGFARGEITWNRILTLCATVVLVQVEPLAHGVSILMVDRFRSIADELML